MKQFLHPQEIQVYYVLPTLRKYFAEYLREGGMKQKDVASILGVTSAGISQYRNSKRGSLVHFPPEIMQEVKKSSGIIKDRFTYIRETQRLLSLLKNSCTMCTIHKQFSPVPENCEPQAVGCHLT